MKITFTQLLFAASLFACTTACSDDETSQPNYNDGVDKGEDIVITDTEVDNTLNVNGGELVITGNTTVTADLNIKEEESDVTISDNVELHKVNIDKGIIRFVGSPIINTDFNAHKGTTIIVGTTDSPISDTVVIKNNLALADTLWVLGGVLVIGTDLNQNSGFIGIADSAKLIVKHDFNQGGNVYGAKNLDVQHVYNHNTGIYSEEPYSVK